MKPSSTSVDVSILTPIAWTGSTVVFFTDANISAGLVFYDPARNEWTKGKAGPCSEIEEFSSTAWLGDRWAIPCGASGLQIFDPLTDAWRSFTAGPSPFNRLRGAAIAWTGNELISWSGTTPSRDNPNPNEGAIIDLSSKR